MKQYEYQTFFCHPKSIHADFLNRLGKDGWELIATLALVDPAGNAIYYFKRPRPEEHVMCGHENIFEEATQGRANAHD